MLSQLRYFTVGIPADQNSQNGAAQQIFEILHYENQIVCCIATYLIPF